MWHNDKCLIIHPRVFKISLTLIKIENDEISVCKNYPIEITEETANVNDIKNIISSKHGFPNMTLLDCSFEIIRDNANTRGELYWNRRFKYFFVNQAEWKEFVERVNNVKLKKVNHPVDLNYVPRAKTTYFPVTLPRTFRRSFTLLKIKNDQIWIYKHLPFNLTEYTANLDYIRKQMINEHGIEDPIVLDRKYKEIRDHVTTRGENFWNTNNIFYFIDRKDWEKFDVEPQCKYHQIKFKKINHSTYFDNSRPNYFKSKESQF
ncbi:unnamed protein product [Brachionus calyciflorus]|uniref:Uncharacterized protein n=1 Tax=Brachionus calyciflorus TaxID=104777 RepID=A0A814J4E7_9BILA|nr:unnamed protein product [Brachionus calyciflorus]